MFDAKILDAGTRMDKHKDAMRRALRDLDNDSLTDLQRHYAAEDYHLHMDAFNAARDDFHRYLNAADSHYMSQRIHDTMPVPLGA